MNPSKYMTAPLLGLLMFIFTACKGQHHAAEKLYLKDVKFSRIFGTNARDTNTIYCLLGQGFFRAPTSLNTDSLLADWIQKHPTATVQKVSSVKIPEKGNPNLQLTYCWGIDGDDNLNIYLVRQGCFSGGTMQRPQTSDEMSGAEMELFDDMEKPEIEVYIQKEAYDSFLEKIRIAEDFAKAHKLGIWAKGNKEQ